MTMSILILMLLAVVAAVLLYVAFGPTPRRTDDNEYGVSQRCISLIVRGETYK